MKVFTHYPALAPAIRKAGYEPCLLEPLVFPPGRVEMRHFVEDGSETLMVVHPDCPAVFLVRGEDTSTWELVR